MTMYLDDAQFQKLSTGVSSLRQAIQNLVLTAAEQQSMQKVLDRNDNLLKEEKAARDAARKKIRLQEKLAKEKRKREIQEMHVKTGYTDYTVRVPGSFEGGKS